MQTQNQKIGRKKNNLIIMNMNYSTIILFILLFILKPSYSKIHPVILVPGDGGSQIEAKLNKTQVVHYLCDKKTSDFYNIWLNLELLVPVIIDCWVDNVRLIYNSTTRTTENSPGVEIRVPGFGNSTVVEFLDPTKASQGLYFNSIVESSLIPLGYSRNISVRGAPYDFRKAPNEMAEYLKDFQALIEKTYEENDKTPIILIGHSMGAPLCQHFLYKVTQAWKDKYIRALMTVGGVWGGSMKALKVFAIGDDLGAYVLHGKTLRGEQRTAPSTAWLLPSKKFWNPEEILVTVGGKRNYTINDFADFFNDMNYPVGEEMRKDTENLLGDHSHPGVEIHCLHGSGVSSVEGMTYKDESYFPEKPTIIYGNGDGTVNIRSLRGCLNWNTADSNDDWKIFNKNLYYKNAHSAKFKKKWKLKMMNSVMAKAKAKGPKVYHEEYPGVDHMQILTDARVLAYIKDVLGRINSAE